jgi:hypothetical protein
MPPAPPVGASAPPRPAAPARPTAPPAPTQITTTDYGYVVGELRRIALLTALILAILLVLWLLLG